jgi:hypothetical protein
MRPLLVGCALLTGMVVVMAQSPSLQVSAQDKPVDKPLPKAAPRAAVKPPADASNPAISGIDPGKESRIRELMDLTGAKNMGQQLIEAGMEQFRSSVLDSQPDNPRAKQFVDAFVTRFQKHFDSSSLTNEVIPIYNKHLSDEDVKGLLEYYHSPLGQRMLKALPAVARESQEKGYALGQKAAEETMEELKAEYPEFTGSQDAKPPAADPKQP